MGGDQETEVAQNLRAEPVTQSDIFEPNQAQLRSMWGAAGNPKPRAHSPLAAAANRTKWFCFGYGFRFVNGRLVASKASSSLWRWAPCTSFAPIVQRPTPSIWLPSARPAAPCAVPAARKSGWRGRRMRSSMAAGAGHGGGRPRRPESDAAAEWEAMAARGRRPGNPGRRQPLDLGRLAGRATKPRRTSKADWPSVPRHDAQDDEAAPQRRPGSRRLFGAAGACSRARQAFVGLPTACAAMGALVAGADRSGASTWCGCCRRPRRSTRWSAWR